MESLDAREFGRFDPAEPAVFQERDGDETAFLFEPDDTVLGIGRRGGPSAQLLARSHPTPHGNARNSVRTWVGRSYTLG